MSRFFFRSTLLLLLVFTGHGSLHAQQDPLWSLYMFNRVVANPAFAGHHEATNFTFSGRSQWVGIDGHPQSFALAYSRPVAKLKGAIGAYAVGDVAGPFSSTEFKLAYAYRIPMGRDGRQSLQIGLSGGFLYKSVDGTNWRPPDNPNDPALINAVASQIVGDLGFGVAWYAPEDRFFVGFSANHLLEPQFTRLTNNIGQSQQNTLGRTFQLTGGYRIDLSRNVQLMPSTSIRLVGNQWQAEVNANLYASPMVFGLGYRHQDAAIALIGFQASSKLFVAYAYDYTLSQLGAASNGSHEIVISYTLPKFIRFAPQNLSPFDNRRRLGR